MDQSLITSCDQSLVRARKGAKSRVTASSAVSSQDEAKVDTRVQQANRALPGAISWVAQTIKQRRMSALGDLRSDATPTVEYLVSKCIQDDVALLEIKEKTSFFGQSSCLRQMRQLPLWNSAVGYDK